MQFYTGQLENNKSKPCDLNSLMSHVVNFLASVGLAVTAQNLK